MREANFYITEPFSKGLRPEDTYVNREGFLEACFNLVPDEVGLKKFEKPTDPFQGGVTVQFPLPQVFLGRDITLYAGTTTIEEVNTGVSPWTKSNIALTNPTSGSSKSLPSGGLWHFADLGQAWYLTRGDAVVFRTGLDNLDATTTDTYATEEITFETIAEHRGRVYIGGMDKDNLWTHFSSIFSSWTGDAGTLPFTLDEDGPNKNWVMWGSIGGGDFPLWLFYPTGYSALGLGPSTTEVLRKIKRNQFGWMPMRWPGTVRVLKALGDNLIVYGDNGITALVPRQGFVGKREIARFGVLGRGAVGGDEEGHIFISQDRELWALGADLNLTRLGYEEWLTAFPSSSTVITLKDAPTDVREYHICSPDEAFVLNANGLAEHTERITSIPYLDGIFYAVHTSGTSTDIRVQTGPFDVRRQALKTIHDIQVLYSDLTDIKVSILYRYNHTENFRTWGPVKVNPQGVVTAGLTGLEFKIKVTGTPGNNPRLDEVEVRWNLVDYRAVRGLFATHDDPTST